MNLNELDHPASDSDSGHSFDPGNQTHQRQFSSVEAPRLPSVPLDPEWVSPFTLPPLPALRKNRGQSNLLRSPEERLHQRSNSSAYYAAAWGSPYATPSPNISPPLRRLGRRSEDLGTASPLSTKTRKTKEFALSSTTLRDESRVSVLKPSSPPVTQRRASSWDRSKTLSERFNWLSESDLSGSEVDIKAERTPTRDTYLKSLKVSDGRTKAPRSRPHQVQESIATVTPETFNAADDSITPSEHNATASKASMESNGVENLDSRPPTGDVDKPLPNLPSPRVSEKMAKLAPTTASPDSPSRPRIQSVQSFQRPKRKVVWKGKTCIIALPLTDQESPGLRTLLSTDEIRENIKKWVTNSPDGDVQSASTGFGQSRPLFPDPQDMFDERKNSKLHVRIPDQGEWDAWVEYLKEEKLRALGVTPSNSEAPMSVQSPFSSTLSRVSSTYPSLAPSPPVSSLSANGNPIRIANNTFSPPLSQPNGMSGHGGSHVASPSISGFPGSMHGYKSSIAQPRMTSPYDYPISHPGSFGPGMRHTPGGYGMRQFSPSIANVPNLGQILSPMIPTVPSNDNGRGMPQNPTMEQIRQQQQRQQQLHQHMMQHQRHYSYVPPVQSKSAEQLPRTPILESPTRQTPEIMHPTPRSHRHNLSAALQKGVDDEEAARSSLQTTVEERIQKAEAEAEAKEVPDIKPESVADEEQEPELPVLKRPETLEDPDEKSEIETNPSIAASPMLMDNTNPFAAPFSNLQQIKDVLEPQSQHKPKVSISKLNVEAAEFDPFARFSSSAFSFGGKSFQPTLSTVEKPSTAVPQSSSTPRNQSISKMNVDAPSFTPTFLAQSATQNSATPNKDTPTKQSIATPSKTSFTFSSPNFNVDAPEFKPGQSISFAAKPHPLSLIDQTALTSAGSIFGSVTVDPNSKSNRRGKAVPIVRPKSSEGDKEELVDDDEGRVGAPTDRQKRARRAGGDDETELLFASSAPFDHAKGLSGKNEPAEAGSVEQAVILTNDDTAPTSGAREEAQIESSSVETAPPAEEIQEPEVNGEAVVQEAPISIERASPVLASKNAEHKAEMPDGILGLKDDNKAQTPTNDTSVATDRHEPKINREDSEVAATARSREGSTLADEVVPQLGARSTDVDQGVSPISVQSDHKSKFSFSALAQPFEFRPSSVVPAATEPPIVHQPKNESKNNKGLMASRFAAVSPEPKSSPLMVSRNNSPPQEMYEYIRPEEARLSAPTLHEPLRGATPTPKLPNMQFDATSPLLRSVEASMRVGTQVRAPSMSPSQHSVVEEPMPTYEEIDAVMKQFETNPELGVERDDTPVKSTPLIDMRLPPTFRSDAPSPSPRRSVLSPHREADWGLGIHRLNEGNDEISDWNEEFSPRQEDKLENQAQYFVSRVNNLVGGILETRLVPLEQTMQTIQESLLSLLDQKSQSRSQRSISSDKKVDSDADDEDDHDAPDNFSSYRSRSPSRSQRKTDKIRAIVMDAMASHQPTLPEQPIVDMSEINTALDEMRRLTQQQTTNQPDIRAMMEDLLVNHPSFKPPKNHDDHEAMQETYRLKMDVLESSLKDAEKRVELEVARRQQADDDMNQLSRKLLAAQEQAVVHREASEDAQSTIAVLLKAEEAYKALQSEHADVLANNQALEDTLAEYRVSSDQFREEIKLERGRNQDLLQMMHTLREEFNEKLESRQILRSQMERLQDRMAQVMHDVHADESEWRKKEHELVIQNRTLQAALEHEVRRRKEIDVALDNMNKEHKENLHFRYQHEQAQEEISRLRSQIVTLNEENKSHQDKLFRSERELSYTKEMTDGEVSKATARFQSELEAARATIESLQSDADAQISRLQKRLDDVELDLEEQKAKHDAVISETIDKHNQTVHEANQRRENALEEQHATHERKLNDLRERHTRALHNSSDDRHRLEYHLNEKLSISEERQKHLESQVRDLEERLEVTKSAARAAVEAATTKAAANMPTPAPSVVASPPQRLSSVSLQLVKGTDIPERISPQAMRESIMVLQDQLQNREQTIEQLEADVAALDKDAPTKIKERDNEITLLRELLGVRVDDLNEIISTLSQPTFDREAAKNAAIRLKANLQMEQQLKERASKSASLSNTLPSMSTISNFAPSPRGLPMAAAAAWGNWRKARDFSISAVSDIATNITQTPSKPNNGNASNFLAGIITPPSASQRTSPASDSRPNSPPPTMRPLAAAAARKNGGSGPEAKPLRSYSTQARTLSSRQVVDRRDSTESTSSDVGRKQLQPQPETPTTPTIRRAFKGLDLGEDVDEDANPLDGNMDEPQEAESTGVDAVQA